MLTTAVTIQDPAPPNIVKHHNGDTMTGAARVFEPQGDCIDPPIRWHDQFITGVARLCAGLLFALLCGLDTARAQTPPPAPGSTFTNVQVSHDAFLAHSEPHLAENPRNPLQLV